LFACSNFYDRLKELRDYHRKFPNTEITEVPCPAQPCPALPSPQQQQQQQCRSGRRALRRRLPASEANPSARPPNGPATCP
jgi:hypothetical protein